MLVYQRVVITDIMGTTTEIMDIVAILFRLILGIMEI